MNTKLFQQGKGNFNQALWLGIGQLSTFAISIVSAAILSRFFDKTEYGTYKQILYVYTTMQTVFTVGLPGAFAYFIPRMNSSQQKTLVNGLNRIFLLLGLLFSVCLFVLSAPIARFLNNPELAMGLKLFSPFPLFTLPTMGVEGMYTALKKTKSIAYYNVFSKTAMLFCIVLPVVLFKSSYKVAVIGWGVAAFLTFIVAMYMKNKPYVEVKKELVPNMYKSIFSYSLPMMGASMAGFFITSADQIFISRYYGTETFAVYSNGCLSVPIIGMIATSVKQVLLPIFSKADAAGNLRGSIGIYNNAVSKSVTIIFPILLFCMFFAKEIMSFFYGQQYESSGVFWQCHMLRDFMDVFPYYSVLLAIAATKVYMYAHIGVAIFTYVIDYLLVKIGCQPYMIVVTSSLLAILLRVVCFIYIYKKTNINLFSKETITNTLKISLHCSFCLVVLMLLKDLFLSSTSPLVILILGGVFYYLIICLSGKLLKVDYLESIKMFIAERKN